MKTCKDCLLEKPLEQFPKNGKWYRNRCKKCHNAKFYQPTGKPNAGRFQKGHVSFFGFKKGNVPHNKGKKTPPEIVAKCAAKLKGKKLSPENLKKLRDGLDRYRKTQTFTSGRRSSKSKNWSRLVKDRDGNKCMHCGSIKRLHAHHIVPWRIDEMKRFDVSNGITLCHWCHDTEERKIFPREVWSKGKTFSDEHRRKLSLAKKGKPPWNKKDKTATGNYTVA